MQSVKLFIKPFINLFLLKIIDLVLYNKIELNWTTIYEEKELLIIFMIYNYLKMKLIVIIQWTRHLPVIMWHFSKFVKL